jgi:hypothetical protein
MGHLTDSVTVETSLNTPLPGLSAVRDRGDAELHDDVGEWATSSWGVRAQHVLVELLAGQRYSASGIEQDQLGVVASANPHGRSWLAARSFIHSPRTEAGLPKPLDRVLEVITLAVERPAVGRRW